jgi:hypothetical protein
VGGSLVELADQGGELVDLALGVGDLGGEELVEAPLDRSAPLAVPERETRSVISSRLQPSCLARAMKDSRAKVSSS